MLTTTDDSNTSPPSAVWTLTDWLRASLQEGLGQNRHYMLVWPRWLADANSQGLNTCMYYECAILCTSRFMSRNSLDLDRLMKRTHYCMTEWRFFIVSGILPHPGFRFIPLAISIEHKIRSY